MTIMIPVTIKVYNKTPKGRDDQPHRTLYPRITANDYDDFAKQLRALVKDVRGAEMMVLNPEKYAEKVREVEWEFT